MAVMMPTAPIKPPIVPAMRNPWLLPTELDPSGVLFPVLSLVMLPLCLGTATIKN